MDVAAAGVVAGTAMAWYAIFNGLAGIAGPMFGGFVRDTTSIVCLFGALLALAIKQGKADDNNDNVTL